MKLSLRQQTLWSVALGAALAFGMGPAASAQDRGHRDRDDKEQDDTQARVDTLRQQAEARQNEVVVQQMALSDCLQYIPGSTIASCSTRTDVNTQAPASNGTVTGAVPVSFSYR